MTIKRRIITAQLVLETAIALADKEGFEAVTLASVAAIPMNRVHFSAR